MNWLGSSECTNNTFAVCICNFFLSCAEKDSKYLKNCKHYNSAILKDFIFLYKLKASNSNSCEIIEA